MKKLNVLLWLYDLQLTNEFISLLSPINDLINLNLSLCEDNNNTNTINKFSKFFSNIKISFHPNAGSDILSFLSSLNQLDENAIFLKIHSKGSNWGIYNQCDWRAILLDSLIGSRDKVLNNIQLLKHDDKSFLANEFFMLNNVEGSNDLYIQEIIDKLNLKTYSKYFAAGTMFYGYKKNFQPILKHLDYFSNELKKYKGKVDDLHGPTMPHSLERLFGYIHPKYTYTPDNKYTFKIKTKHASKINLSPSSEFVDLNILYNQDCYLLPNANYYGKVIERNPNKLIIKWIYLEKPVVRTYYKIADKTFSS